MLEHLEGMKKSVTLSLKINAYLRKNLRLMMEISRDLYLRSMIGSKHNGMIKVITGVRRCGKSYLLFNLFYKHLKESGIPEDHIVKVDLEDRRNLSLRDPDALLGYIDSQMRDNDMYYILLDEVQYVREFEDVLNSYMHVRNADVYVTGSNSRFLSSDIITEFRGRGEEIRIHPLCFREFMSVYQGESRNAALQEYMTYGGLPQVVTQQETEKKRTYLERLFETTYLKDIKERHRIREDANLVELIDVMASSIGSLTNPMNLQNTFKSVTGSGVSLETIKRYLDILQDSFIIEKTVRYDVKGRKYIGTPSKYYFEDLGLRNARLKWRQFDQGHMMENMLYNELRLRGYFVDVGQVPYNYKDEKGRSLRKNLEVDFVCNRGFTRIYIQSAFNIHTGDMEEREYRSLLQIKDSFQKMVVVGGLTPSHQNNDGIIIMNIFDFLMAENLGEFV